VRKALERGVVSYKRVLALPRASLPTRWQPSRRYRPTSTPSALLPASWPSGMSSRDIASRRQLAASPSPPNCHTPFVLTGAVWGGYRECVADVDIW